MKILFVTNSNPYSIKPYGGAESSLRLLAEKLANRGHRVIFLTSAVKAYQKKEALSHNVKLKGFINVRLRGLRRFRLVSLLQSRLLSGRMKFLCRLLKIQLVHCFYDPLILEPAVRVRQTIPGLKLVMRMAGKHWYEISKRKPHMKERYTHYFSQVDAVNYISQDLVTLTASAMRDLGMDFHFKNSFVLDIGSSTIAQRNIPYQLSDNSCFRIVMISRFSNYQKRQDLLLRAIAQISDGAQVSATFIGEGPNRQKIKDLAEQLKIGDRVSFLPFLQQEDVWKEMEKFHLMCHCVEYEGLSKIIIESMSLGLPVLASDVKPMNTYICEGYNGFLVDNRPALWAEKIDRLSHSPELLSFVSEKSVDYVYENYNPDKNVVGYEREFSSIIDKG